MKENNQHFLMKTHKGEYIAENKKDEIITIDDPKLNNSNNKLTTKEIEESQSNGFSIRDDK